MKRNSIYKTSAGEKEIMSFYDSVLNEWPVPYETKMLPTRQGYSFVIVCGKVNAPALILLHGAASNSTSWAGDISAYCSHFRVFAVDIPGEPGKSDKTRPSWHGFEFAEWLEDVFYELKIDKASLLGISQGAWTALRFTSYAPEKVNKLILLTPAGIVPTKSSFVLKAIICSMFGRYGVKKLNRYIFGKQPMHPKAIEFMDLILTHFKARIEKEYIFTDDELKKLIMPVLLLGGTEDIVRSCEAIVTRMSKFVPHLKAIIIPGMGHVLVPITNYIIPLVLEEDNL